MSERRRYLSRPRTRVYDCNYNLGERYYKPVVDSLDRKYGGGLSDRLNIVEEPISRSSPFESRPSRSTANNIEDDFESDVVSSIQRLKASRAARQELEDELDALATERNMKKRGAALAAARESILEDDLDSAMLGRKKKGFFQDQLLDTIGVNNKLQKSLAEESIASFKKKAQTAIDEFDEETPQRGLSVIRRGGRNEATLRRGILSGNAVCVRVPRLTKWTALKTGSLTEQLEESVDEKAARARARQSRARLVDLDAEMDALVERGAAREKRIQGLKSLLSETSSGSEETSSNIQVKSRITKAEKKVAF
ncbi:uncharacterized protein LOC142328839 isoform X2 [Lycorma delicatula]